MIHSALEEKQRCLLRVMIACLSNPRTNQSHSRRLGDPRHSPRGMIGYMDNTPSNQDLSSIRGKYLFYSRSEDAMVGGRSPPGAFQGKKGMAMDMAANAVTRRVEAFMLTICAGVCDLFDSMYRRE